MYSLPITTYTDYWRRTKLWSVYFGSLAVLVAGSRYSSLREPGIGEKTQPPPLAAESLNLDSLSTNELSKEVLISSLSSRNLARQELMGQGQISRGVNSTSQDDQVIPSSEPETEVTSKIEVVDREIPFATEYIESDELPPGTSQIQRKGEKGIRREVVKTFEVDGQPVDQQVQSFFVIKTPETEVIIRNTKPIAKKKVTIQNSKPESTNADADLSKLNILKTLSVEATAYTYTGSNTATGVKPREGLIAVDPKVIAMGSKVYVEGYGYAIAADTGGDIRGNRIDVFFSTLRQCIDWGRKSVRIHVLDTK
ncbi:MAG: hypothetical protein H6Q63_553 [Firmicutes bacterium]|nr:hypothetical protein [Bacillota bacterium]